MELSYSLHGDVLVVTPEADRIDAAIAIRFKEEMRQLTEGVSGRVVLDLEPVTFIDSSGLGAIVAVKKLMGTSVKLELAGLQPNVDKVFRLTRMDSVFPIHASAQDAVSAAAHQAV